MRIASLILIISAIPFSPINGSTSKKLGQSEIIKVDGISRKRSSDWNGPSMNPSKPGETTYKADPSARDQKAENPQPASNLSNLIRAQRTNSAE